MQPQAEKVCKYGQGKDPWFPIPFSSVWASVRSELQGQTAPLICPSKVIPEFIFSLVFITTNTTSRELHSCKVKI